MWILEPPVNSKWYTCILPNTMSFKMRCLFEFRCLHKVLATVWPRLMDENHQLGFLLTAKTLHLPVSISKIVNNVSKEEVLIILFVLKVRKFTHVFRTYVCNFRTMFDTSVTLKCSRRQCSVYKHVGEKDRKNLEGSGQNVFTTCAIIGHHWEVKVKVGPLEPRPTPRCVKVRSRASPSVRLSGHRKLPHPDRDGHPVTQRIVLQDLAEEQREVGV